VTTPEDFPVLQNRLATLLGAPIHVDHPTYASAHFSHFISPDGVNLDIMAGIRVRTNIGFKSWEFNPRTLVMANGLPWMQPQDWQDSYEMFNRPERASLLSNYLES
jgi:hypothetical protein